MVSPYVEAGQKYKKVDLKNLKLQTHSGDYLNKVVVPKQEPDEVSKAFTFESGLNEMGVEYRKLSEMREMRKNHFLNTQLDEMTYTRTTQDLMTRYFRNLTKDRFRTTTRKARLALKSEVKDFKKNKAKHKDKLVLSSGIGHHSIIGEHNDQQDIAMETFQEEVRARPEQYEESSDMGLDEVLHDAWTFGEKVVNDHQSISLWPEAEARLHFDLPRTTMHMNLYSSILDGEVLYRVSDQGLPLSGVGSMQDDAMTFALMRSIPVLSLATGVKYGFYRSTLDYSVSKRLVGPISAQVGHTQFLKKNNPDNTTYQLNLGFGF